ncbi:hypothetical protein F7725_005956 [Dissostichus mawsoni]|uniref:Uncharacterized protein n=1 Tax=Dissostichus mawsoni TaxID=36200 RepID=A0A7J5YUU4_DISMA|nr:hypothetical protein F7725_005956 [Dissostichus mawsoni]
MTPPTDQILKRLDTFFQTKPDHMWSSLIQLLLDLLSPEVPAPVESLRAAETEVGVFALDQLFCGLTVELQPLGLQCFLPAHSSMSSMDSAAPGTSRL